MSRLYRIAPRAEEDLLDIWEYVARDNVAAATRMLERFDRKFLMASRQPDIGEARLDLAPDLRCLIEGRYVIFYRPPCGPRRPGFGRRPEARRRRDISATTSDAAATLDLARRR